MKKTPLEENVYRIAQLLDESSVRTEADFKEAECLINLLEEMVETGFQENYTTYTMPLDADEHESLMDYIKTKKVRDHITSRKENVIHVNFTCAAT